MTTRRDFLTATAALPLLGPALFAQDRPAPSNRITMALIGCGGQGTGDMGGFMSYPEVQFVAVCDPVPEHREQARKKVNEKYKNTDCKEYSDFRDVLARDDIDAILIGTPDHWHAIITIEACKRGKDIYCEKPECLTIREGRAMADAIARYGRVFSGGSQRVLGDYGDWPRQIWGGAIGTVKEVYVDCGGPSGDCYLPEEPLPAGLDWNMWLGPAPYRGYNKSLTKGNFRPFRDYSGGGMTDWGAHRFGAALFATGHHLTGPTDVIPPDGKEHKQLTFKFADGMVMYHGGTSNITYKGTEGELIPNQPRKGGVPPRASDMPTYKGKGGIFGDFLHCVKTREKPFRNIEVAQRACTVCHLGNIAYWLNRPLKWDPVAEMILGDVEAARWLDRPKREPWALS
jgi:predicted dehydrogenase